MHLSSLHKKKKRLDIKQRLIGLELKSKTITKEHAFTALAQVLLENVQIVKEIVRK